MMLYRWAPGLRRPWQGVCVYNGDDQLSGYCVGDFMMPFKEGFQVLHPDRTPFATARRSRTDGGYHLTFAGTERSLGTVNREPDGPAVSGGTIIRHRVSMAEETSQQAHGRFFLLAAAIAIVIIDLGHG
jgi:hypothetical protein